MNSRLTLAAVAAAASLFFSTDSAAQAKSNIQDDPQSSSCTENCVDAGYEWAIANEPQVEDDCVASNGDFADGVSTCAGLPMPISTGPMPMPSVIARVRL